MFIIGNGFDRAHNLPTDYRKNLIPILAKDNENEFDFINKIFFNNDEELWSDFENNIGNLKNDEPIIKRTREEIDDFFANNSDPSAYSYSPEDENYGDQYTEVENATYEAESNKVDYGEIEFSNLKSFVDRGMLKMVIEANNEILKRNKLKLKDFNSANLYLTFNYTETLEKLYRIPSSRIFHIHGKIGEEMVYGNDLNNITILDREDISLDLDNNYLEIEENDTNYPSNLNDFVHAVTYSDDERRSIELDLVSKVNEESSTFEKELRLEDLSDWINPYVEEIQEVRVLGHSLGYVDREYFSWLNRILNNPEWNISYYHCKDTDPVVQNGEFLRSQNSDVHFKRFAEFCM